MDLADISYFDFTTRCNVDLAAISYFDFTTRCNVDPAEVGCLYLPFDATWIRPTLVV